MNRQEALSEWVEHNQPFELNYQKCYNYRDFDEWDKTWNLIFKKFDLSRDSFHDSILVDIGCGSKPALSYFSKDNEKHCTDPLLTEFLSIEKVDCGCTIEKQIRLRACTLPAHTKFHKRYADKPDINVRSWFEDENYILHSLAYETFIPSLENKVDFLLCWNVLDHGYDWKLGIENIIRYLKTGGMLLLATDFEKHKYHIGIDNPSELKDMVNDNFEIIKSVNTGLVTDRDYMILGEKICLN